MTSLASKTSSAYLWATGGAVVVGGAIWLWKRASSRNEIPSPSALFSSNAGGVGFEGRPELLGVNGGKVRFEVEAQDCWNASQNGTHFVGVLVIQPHGFDAGKHIGRMFIAPTSPPGAGVVLHINGHESFVDRENRYSMIPDRRDQGQTYHQALADEINRHEPTIAQHAMLGFGLKKTGEAECAVTLRSGTLNSSNKGTVPFRESGLWSDDRHVSRSKYEEWATLFEECAYDLVGERGLVNVEPYLTE
jgi:hypothetical protein